jgi:hypothetical protein
LLVQLDRELDRPQPAHPRQRPAERGELRVGGGPEVAQPGWQRRACERISLHVLRQRFPFAPVAWRLRAGHALSQDRLALTPFHDASVPAAP